jgi:hypothetical protein
MMRADENSDTPSEAPRAPEGLTRVTVNLTPRAIAALERACRATGDTKTDTINRALQVYAVVQEIADRNGGSIRLVHEDGGIERLHLL